jgi:glucose-6-phosphate 1-dehydrogenase
MFEENAKPLECLFVIFGATGDLTHRKILPAMYALAHKNLLPDNFALVAVARRDKTHDDYRKDVKESILKYEKKTDESSLNNLLNKTYYFKSDIEKESNYPEMKLFFDDLDRKYKTKGNRIFYLSTLPSHFGSIADNLKKNGFVTRTNKKQYRIIIEKPFGSDLDSAVLLNNKLSSIFKEREIFRIDHYLGKEAIQNLFAFRFANRIFESIWNKENIDNIQITVAESLGVETRGGYYDNYGALKDMIQNHLLQMLSIVAMEIPKEFTTKEIKKEKVKVLNAISTMDDDTIKKNVVFGQYSKGVSGEGYTDEPGVTKESKIETYIGLKLNINNKRWDGVPIYLRTGKRLARKASEIVIYFKEPKMKIFSSHTAKQNVLVVRIQPNEGIYLRFNAKEPGQEFKIQEVSMDFCHECLFGINTPEAYEKLIYDTFLGDSTLFTRWDEVEAAWKIIDPISGYFKRNNLNPLPYESGTWGPIASDELTNRSGHHWREPI